MIFLEINLKHMPECTLTGRQMLMDVAICTRWSFFGDWPQARARIPLNREARHPQEQRSVCSDLFLEIKLKHLLTLVCISMGNFLSKSKYPFTTTFAAALTMGVHLFLSVPNVLPTPSNIPNLRLGKSSKIFFPTNIQISPCVNTVLVPGSDFSLSGPGYAFLK